MANTKEIRALAIVSYKYLPAKLGGQKGIAFFYDFFSSLVTTTCVSVKDTAVSDAKDYEVLNILQNGKLRYINPVYFFILKKIIRQRKITHLILEHPYYGWLGILLKIFCKVKLVVHSHNIEAQRFKSLGKWWWGILWNYERLTHRFADHNFFIHQDDRDYGISKFKLKPEKCFVITYGFQLTAPPMQADKALARATISSLYNIRRTEKILLFNGSLNYTPNINALDNILTTINPLLMAGKELEYRIIICGANMAGSYNDLKDYKDKNIIYAGFVDDINLFYKGADIFINPVIDGGGIKTKLVEALGYDMNVVTTKSGATGVPLHITGEKMKVVEDNDWKSFAAAVLSSNTTSTIPEIYFDHFYWGKIAEKAALILQEGISGKENVN